MRKIKDIRTYLNITQNQFGNYFGIPLRSIQNWETGKSNPPSYVIDMIERIIGLEEEVSGLTRLKNICDLTNNPCYIRQTHSSTGILLCADGRPLKELSDDSIDCIITDHPWKNNKANISGTRNFADYLTFTYKLEDFENKARVLKEGCYMAEFLPRRSATNKNYLNQIEEIAEGCGFMVYTYLNWHYSDYINTGRTKKGTQQIVIFSKGKPRRLSPTHISGYMTQNILKDIDVPIVQSKKLHQAEKPITVYEYLISNLTKEGETILDQFGGSCNALQAALNTNRNAIVYEINNKYVDKAVKHFHLLKYC